MCQVFYHKMRQLLQNASLHSHCQELLGIKVEKIKILRAF